MEKQTASKKHLPIDKDIEELLFGPEGPQDKKYEEPIP